MQSLYSGATPNEKKAQKVSFVFSYSRFGHTAIGTYPLNRIRFHLKQFLNRSIIIIIIYACVPFLCPQNLMKNKKGTQGVYRTYGTLGIILKFVKSREGPDRLFVHFATEHYPRRCPGSSFRFVPSRNGVGAKRGRNVFKNAHDHPLSYINSQGILYYSSPCKNRRIFGTNQKLKWLYFCLRTSQALDLSYVKRYWQYLSMYQKQSA